MAFSGVQLPASLVSKSLIAGATLAIATLIGASLIWSPVHRVLRRGNGPVYSEAAKAMIDEGMKAGDRLAVVADEPFGEGGAFVARLARMRIVAVVAKPEQFWAAQVNTRSQVIKALAGAGANVLLTRNPPPAPDLAWKKLGCSDYYILERSRQ
jgi:hypothetical protein